MIKVKNISFKYTDEEVILEDASLHIKPSKITVVLGKNGVGKTTLLSLIDGFLTEDSGEIHKAEESIYIYDQPFLYEYLTGDEYLELFRQLSKDHYFNHMDALIEELELTDAMDKLISDYSLGMKHKLAILTALSLNYKLYLIDEPLAALDPDSQKFMIEFFKKMRENGRTLVISTHMMHIAYQLADEIVIFKNHQLEIHENNFDSFEAFEAFVIQSLRMTFEEE